MMYQIQIKRQIHQTVMVPQAILNQNIRFISFGKRKSSCRIDGHSGTANNIFVSTDIAEALLLPERINIKAVIVHDTLMLGPVVGIFTAGFYKSLLRPIGSRSMFFSKLITNGFSTGAFCYIFGSHQIEWDEEYIKGYTFGHTGWRRAAFPFPDVIYDRLPNRKVERLALYQKIKKKFSENYSISTFNPGFFNKWHIYQLLMKDPKTSKYLPVTCCSPTISQLNGLLDLYQMIYLKPADGSLGLGVFQLERRNSGKTISCRFHRQDGSICIEQYPTVEMFLHDQFTGRSLNQYIAQQGICLLQTEEKPIDFRVHTNKNINGEWVVSAMAAKVAGKGNITTHIKNGGTVKSLNELKLPIDSGNLDFLLRQSALIISEVIDLSMEGQVGEIGFDFGIDQSGKIWMFEANSKPGRSIFLHKDLKEADVLTMRFPFQYAAYLMKKSVESGGIYADVP